MSPSGTEQIRLNQYIYVSLSCFFVALEDLLSIGELTTLGAVGLGPVAATLSVAAFPWSPTVLGGDSDLTGVVALLATVCSSGPSLSVSGGMST